MLIEEPSPGVRRFHPYEPEGPTPRVQVDLDDGQSARLAVLSGGLERLGLPSSGWDRVEGPSRPLGQLGITRSLVLGLEAEAAAFREDPTQFSALAAMLVPDLRSCVRLSVRQDAISDQPARVEVVVGLGEDRALVLDREGQLLLYADGGRAEVHRTGSGALFPRGMAFDPTRRELWLTSELSSDLARASVPSGAFDSLSFQSVPLEEGRRIRSIDGVTLGPEGPFVLAVLEADFDGTAQVRIRSEPMSERLLDLGVFDPSGLQVHAAGTDVAFLHSEVALWRVRAGGSPEALALPGTHSIHSARYSDRFGLLVGLSNGTILRAGDEALETLLEVGGWWVLDVVPFERGFAYLLANGVVGQFIEGQGRCPETPVLGTLIHGYLVPGRDHWFVSGALPGSGAGTRFAWVPRE